MSQFEVRYTTLVKTCYLIFFLLKRYKAITVASLLVVRSKRNNPCRGFNPCLGRGRLLIKAVTVVFYCYFLSFLLMFSLLLRKMWVLTVWEWVSDKPVDESAELDA